MSEGVLEGCAVRALLPWEGGTVVGLWLMGGVG